MICKLMQMDVNDMKVEKSVSIHSHTLELPGKRQIVTDTKSRNAYDQGSFPTLPSNPHQIFAHSWYTFKSLIKSFFQIQNIITLS